MGWVTFVIVKVIEERDQLFFVHNQNIQNRLSFVGVRNKHFKHMERLKLNALALIAQHAHHQFQVLLVTDVSGHHIKVGPIKKKLSKQLEKPTYELIIIT